MNFERHRTQQDDRRESVLPPVADKGTQPGNLPEFAARRLLEAELAFERAVAANRELAVFRRNVATWELLLMLAFSRDAATLGVHGLVDAVRSRGLGQSALLRFLRERRDDGQVIIEPDPAKRSRQRVTLRPDLTLALEATLLARQRASSEENRDG